MQVRKPKQGYKLVENFFHKYIEIPIEWEYPRFSEIVNVNPLTKIVEEKIPYIPMDSVDTEKPHFNYFEERKLSEYTSLPKFQENDILFASITPSTENGKTCIVENFSRKGIGSSELTVLRPTTKVIPRYLYYYVKSHRIRQFAISQMMGTTGRQRVPDYVFKKDLNFELPSLNEQQKIVSILSNVDSLIQQTQKEIEQTQRYKKGLMQKLLTKGIGHTKFKTEELGRKFLKYEIPENWSVSKLNKFATVHGRIGWKNLRVDEYMDNGPLMLSVWSLVETVPYGVDYNEGVHRLSQFRYDESPEIKLQNNDVLIAKDGDIGRIGFVKKLPEPATVNSHVVPIRVFDKSVNPEFLYWYMKTKQFQAYCIAFTSGTTVPLFTQKDLRNTKIPIPPLPEQEKISLILSGNASIIHLFQQKKLKLENLKKGLMQKLLTGQLRVKV